MKFYCSIISHAFLLIVLTSSILIAQKDVPDNSDFFYRGIKIMSSPAKTIHKDGVEIEIGAPFIIAAKDESPDEGYFVGPKLLNLWDAIYVNWRFDWDVVDGISAQIPNGRVSYDGGISWEKQRQVYSPGSRYMTGDHEVTLYFKDAFEIPGFPGHYKVPTWRSNDRGLTWGDTLWTEIVYPGTKGINIYDPPEAYKKNDRNYARGGTVPIPPEYLLSFFRKVSPNRRQGESIRPQVTDNDGVIYSVTYGRPGLKTTSGINDWEKDYWKKINWNRYAIYMHTSCDSGKTWEYRSIVANGEDYEGEIDFHPGDGFSEPSLVIFPDGEMLCVMRTGHYKPLYCTRSLDKGQSWSKPKMLASEEDVPIPGVTPKLVLLDNQMLLVATGRPDVRVHFSIDRGKSWFGSDTLYYSTSSFIGSTDSIYANSHHNIDMIQSGKNCVLIVHDATRRDESERNDWLKKHGHGLIIGRIISLCGH